jgi:hypothetical protein
MTLTVLILMTLHIEDHVIGIPQLPIPLSYYLLSLYLTHLIWRRGFMNWSRLHSTSLPTECMLIKCSTQLTLLSTDTYILQTVQLKFFIGEFHLQYCISYTHTFCALQPLHSSMHNNYTNTWQQYFYYRLHTHGCCSFSLAVALLPQVDTEIM